MKKISSRCNPPKLANILRKEAENLNKKPSRLVAEIVVQFVESPPPEGDGWWEAPARIVRSLSGRDTISAAVPAETEKRFQMSISKVGGVKTKSQLLAWVVWNHLGRPSDRS